MEEKKERKMLNFFITSLNGMAYGLFSTLIIGTIIGTIATIIKSINLPFTNDIYNVLNSNNGISYILQILTGAGIGIGIAIALKLDSLKTIVLAMSGEIAAFYSLSTKFVTNGAYQNTLKIGDPLTIFLVCILVYFLMKLVLRKKTPVDILIVPLFGILISCIISLIIRYPAIYITYAVQFIVNEGTNQAPFLMGIIVSIVMGMALTAPISSAAIAAMIFTLPNGITIDTAINLKEYSGLIIASGAAVVGCSTQMVGFAVEARKDNPIGMVISIGIGTSMLEFKNILKKPIIWLPTIIASAILGPISTCLLKIKCIGSSAGMGTAGLVGQIGTFASMNNSWQMWVGIFGLEIILPIILVYIIDLIFRKYDLIKPGDFTI